MLLGLLRYAKGYVFLEARGKFPERFINLTAQRGIPFWDVHPVKGGVEGGMYVSDYRRIRDTARRAGVRTRIISRHGLPFFAAKYRSRAGLPAGAVLGAALLVLLSNFVWTVEVTGLHSVSCESFERLLAQNGVEPGALRSSIDVGKAERSILLETPELTWLSINLLGSHADVEVKEKVQKPDSGDKTRPCNIKARTDGVVTKINAARGTAAVKTGSGVVRGDILVSGVSPGKQNDVRWVHAEAEVFADVYSKKELSLPKQLDYYYASDNKTDRLRLRFLNAEIPFSLSFNAYSESAETYSRSLLTVNGRRLPLGFVTQTSHEMIPAHEELDRGRAEKIFNTSLLLYEVFERGGGVLNGKSVTVSETDDGYNCTADYVFNENIAEPAPFDVTEEE